MDQFRSFVSESEIGEEKKKRQAEWDRVRKPDDPKEAPEPEVDNRPLFVRLKEQKEKEQAEYDESHRLKHMVRGLDNEEVDFLEMVDTVKLKEERKRKAEEEEVLLDYKALAESSDATDGPTTSTLPSGGDSTKKPPVKPTTSNINKQAQLLAGLVKKPKKSSGTITESSVVNSAVSTGERREDADSTVPDEDMDTATVTPSDLTKQCMTNGMYKVGNASSALIKVGVRPSAFLKDDQSRSPIPGINDLSSDSDSSEESSEDELGHSGAQMQRVKEVQVKGGRIIGVSQR